MILGKLTDPEVEVMVIELRREGSSYVDLTSFVKSLYGTHVSTKLLSRVTGSVEKNCREYHNRQLKEQYDCICMDRLYIRAENARKAALLGVLGTALQNFL